MKTLPKPMSASQEYLEKLYELIFVPISRSQCVTVKTFSGSGKWANIKYAIDNISSFSTELDNALFIPLTSKRLIHSTEEEISNGVAFMIAKAAIQNRPLPKEYVTRLSQIETSQEFSSLLAELITRMQKRVVLVVHNSEALLNKNRYSRIIQSKVLSILSIDVTKVQAIFLEMSETSQPIDVLGPLQRFYIQNTVYEKNIPFDEKSILETIKNLELDKKLRLSKVAKENVINLANGDALLLKEVLTKYGEKSEVRKIIDTNELQKNTGKLYSQLNDEFLDAHFNKLLSRVSAKSKDYLYGITSEPTESLINANITQNNGAINLLLKYFVENRSQRFPYSNNKLDLTPQEERLFNLLLDSLGKTIIREDAAQAIWQEEWKSRYSEQGIDKIVSNLRSKLDNSQYVVKSIKKQGIMAELLDD